MDSNNIYKAVTEENAESLNVVIYREPGITERIENTSGNNIISFPANWNPVFLHLIKWDKNTPIDIIANNNFKFIIKSVLPQMYSQPSPITQKRNLTGPFFFSF